MSIAYRYAVIRAVPRADRDEHLNLGVIVYCQATQFLGARFADDLDYLRALGLDDDGIAGVAATIAAIRAMCAGESAAGPAASRPPSFRFGHLTAPRSTVVRSGPAHGGVGDDPAVALDELFTALVAR